MATPDYIQDLALSLYGQQAQDTITAENPYYSFKSVPDGISSLVSQIAAKNPTQYSIGELAGTSAASGILSGILQGIGNNYQNDNLTKYQNTINMFRGDQAPTEESSGLSSNLFKKAQDTASLFKIRQELNNQQLAAEDTRAIDKQVNLLTDPRIVAATPAKPDPLLGDKIKETAILAKKDQSFNFIDNAFEQAKKLSGGEALTSFGGIAGMLGAPTNANNQITSLGDSLVVQIDNALGREINSDVRQRLLSLAPKLRDSDSVLDTKKTQLKDLLSSLAAPTPILDAQKAAKLALTSELPVSATKPTQSITPDQARALLKAKGVPGY